ncbi:YdcH family protein [Taklimakanibacter lacteus]|uniref:YdcH family protein n=1 Tax=Taklimakanibacter lacteus TaxID=2268456 RepID=UPI000E6746CC
MNNGTEENLLQTRLMTLRQQHRDLDAAISSLEASGTGDQLQLRRLKKMKLQIKDEIQKVEDKLIPDIIA